MDIIRIGFAKSIIPHLNDLLNLSLSHLHDLLPAFDRYYLTASDSPPTQSEDEPIQLAMLGCPIIDFIAASIRGKGKAWLQPVTLENLTISLFGWMQMTEEDVSFEFVGDAQF